MCLRQSVGKVFVQYWSVIECAGERLSPVAADIKLETESDLGSDDDLPSTDCRYRPRQALKMAMTEWLRELSCNRDPPKRALPAASVVSIPPGVPVSPTLNDVADVLSASCDSSAVDSTIELSSITKPVLQSAPLPQPINSLAGNSISDVSDSVSDSLSDCSCEIEPMECVQSSSAVLVASNLNVINTLRAASPAHPVDSSDVLMQEEDVCQGPGKTQNISNTVLTPSLLTAENVSLLVDLFYLPFEYGSSSLQYLQELQWLLTSAHCLQGSEDATKVNNEKSERV